MENRQIRIYARKAEGRNFYNFSFYSEKTAKFYQVAFKQGGKNQPNPKNDGYYLLTVAKDQISGPRKNRRKEVTDNKTGEIKTFLLNDEIFINDVVEWKEDVEYLEQRKKEMEAELEEIL